MRFGELLRMEWGRVDYERRVYVTDPRWTKMNKEREVPLGDVALEILKKLRPADAKPRDPVWTNSLGRPLRDIDSVLKRAMKKDALKALFPEPRPGWRLPDRHSFRRTCASAVAQVAPLAVVSAILGHAATTVTDLYVSIPLADQIAALNRAALLIDGDPKANVVPMVPKTGEKTGQVA
jgi:integrase